MQQANLQRCTENRGLLTKQALLLSEKAYLGSKLLRLPVKLLLPLSCCFAVQNGVSCLPRTDRVLRDHMVNQLSSERTCVSA